MGIILSRNKGMYRDLSVYVIQMHQILYYVQEMLFVQGKIHLYVTWTKVQGFLKYKITDLSTERIF